MSERILLPYSKENLRTWIEIDRENIKNNIKSIRGVLGEKVELWPVVKSNAYGHDLVCMAKLLQEYKVDGLCVDTLMEGISIREVGVKMPILVLGAVLPGNLSLAFDFNIAVTLSNRDIFSKFLDIKEKPNFHIKFDTGMHRQGFLGEDVLWVKNKIKENNLESKFKGIYTHFAKASEKESLERQFNLFKDILDKFKNYNVLKHSAASGAVLYSKKYHLDIVRVGLACYGYYPFNSLKNIGLKPALKWKTRVVEIKKIKKGESVGYDFTETLDRDSVVGILPIGYWHGVDRSLSSKEVFICKGKKIKILGRVTMDMCIVDLTDIDGVSIYDEIEVNLEKMAVLGETIIYEIITRINPKIYRLYG